MLVAELLPYSADLLNSGVLLHVSNVPDTTLCDDDALCDDDNEDDTEHNTSSPY